MNTIGEIIKSELDGTTVKRTGERIKYGQSTVTSIFLAVAESVGKVWTLNSPLSPGTESQIKSLVRDSIKKEFVWGGATIQFHDE